MNVEPKISVALKRRLEHLVKHDERSVRLDAGIFGVIQKPIIDRSGGPFIDDQPTYLSSVQTAKSSKLIKKKSTKNNIDRISAQIMINNLDFRCFYSGVVCHHTDGKQHNYDPKENPWIGTKDHLVPARRFLETPFDITKYQNNCVWTSHIVNVTLGLIPLMVRLKIRQWLSTTPFDRSDTSIEAGNNLRWIVIEMINEFRMKNRYLWSRNPDGRWWYPDLAEPFMKRMWNEEERFLQMSLEDRNDYINNFNWQF